VDRAGPESRERAHLDEGACCGAVSEDKQQRSWQLWLDEDVERAAAWAGGRNHELASLSRLPDLGRRHDPHQLRNALGQRAQGFAADDRLRAASTDPAM